MKKSVLFFVLLSAVFLISACEKAEPEHVHLYSGTEYPATCEADGYKEFICECGDSYAEKTEDKLGHLYFWTLESESDGNITEKGECVVCKKTQEKVSNTASYDFSEADTAYFDSVKKTVPQNFVEYCSEDSSKELEAVLAYISENNGKMTNSELCAAAEKITEAVNKLEYKKGGITQIFISSAEEITSDGYISCQIAVVPSAKNETEFFYDSEAKIKVRGNSTALADKKGYNFKLSSKKDMFGFGEAKKWALLANAYDKSLIRNKLALDLQKEMGITYSSESTFADVWVNGVYAGNFQLAESVETGKNRVDIDTDSGDFLLEVENQRVEDGVDYIISPEYGIRFAVNEPESLSDEQKSALYGILGNVEKAIKSGQYSEIEKVIDTESFAAFYVFSEFMKQVDFSFSSTRFYLKNGILYAGPGWDFDLSSGNIEGTYDDYIRYNNENGTGEKTGKSSDGLWAVDFEWYKALLEIPEFRSLVKRTFSKYSDTLQNVYKDNSLGRSRINLLQSEFGSSFNRNYTSAGWSLTEDLGGGKPVTGNYSSCISYLKTWFAERYEYLDKIY